MPRVFLAEDMIVEVIKAEGFVAEDIIVEGIKAEDGICHTQIV